MSIWPVPGALCVEADVTISVALDGFVDATLTQFGQLDGTVNNAGRSAGIPVDLSYDTERRSDYELKVISALHVLRRVMGALEETTG